MRILDMCCGSKMFWFDKDNPLVDFCDLHPRHEKLDSGHVINCTPDYVADFRNLPADNNIYDLVVFDPPHLLNAGDSSWLAKKYGKLNIETWEDDLLKGFNEAYRVMKDNATLIFKWNEEQVSLSEIKEIIRQTKLNLLFGNKRSKTHWLVLCKKEVSE